MPSKPRLSRPLRTSSIAPGPLRARPDRASQWAAFGVRLRPLAAVLPALGRFAAQLAHPEFGRPKAAAFDANTGPEGVMHAQAEDVIRQLPGRGVVADGLAEQHPELRPHLRNAARRHRNIDLEKAGKEKDSI